MDSLYIVMPAYNEEANIEATVRQWYPLLEGKSEDSRLVVADDGSSDRTHEILLELAKELPKLNIYNGCDRQHGPKLIAMYNFAVSNNADYIFQTDSDGQTNPGEFDAFWEMRNRYDAIIGCRPVRGDGKDRAFVEKVVCLLLKLYFGVDVPDANAPFRLMKSELVERYLGKLPADYNLPNIMMTTYFSRYSENITFKEISFKPRQGGKNSLNIPRIIKIGWKALGDFMTFKRDMKQKN